MSRVTDWLGWLIARLGWPGIAGVVLLLGTAALQHWLLAAMATQKADLIAQAATLEALQSRQAAAPPPSEALEPLTDAPASPETLGRLFKAASRVGLALMQGEYRLQGGSGGAGPLRYQIVLPAQASYPVLRSFLADALNANPALALDGITLSRERVEDGELKAVLRFTLYLEAGKRP